MGIRYWLVLALAGGAVQPLVGQARPDTSRRSDTSLAARLDRAERLIQVLQQQMAEQARARVEPREGNKVELSGLVLLNGFYNNAKVNNSDIPTYVLPPDPPGSLPILALGGTVRQTELTLTTHAPRVLGGSFTGELDMDFYGGQIQFARLFPLLHVKRTRAELRWPHAWVMVGEEAPPISDVNPSTFAARSIPGFELFEESWDDRAPLGWNVKDPSPVAAACVALFSDLFPATTGDYFGSRNATSNYGFMYSAKGVSSIIGAGIGAMLYERFNSWAAPFYGSAILALLSAFTAFFLLSWSLPKKKAPEVVREHVAVKSV